jgi:CheY-like chemotaxis protein
MNATTILHVEDEETDILLFQHVYSQAGLTTLLKTVKDGKAAMDYLAGNAPFDDRRLYPLPGLVLLDLNLPYWSGLEVLVWIRQQPHLRRLPVVVLTSSRRPEDIARAYDAGANAYLVKPNALAELRAQVLALSQFWLAHNQLPESLGVRPAGAAKPAKTG